MSITPRVVIIGAGIVGANLADELTARGWDRCHRGRPGTAAADRGLHLARAGAGLPDQRLQDDDGVRELHGREATSIDVDGAWCFNQVGGLEVATTPERLADLHRRQGWATSWGVEAEVVGAEECVRLHPLLDAERVLGGLHVPATAWPRPPARSWRWPAAPRRGAPLPGLDTR